MEESCPGKEDQSLSQPSQFLAIFCVRKNLISLPEPTALEQALRMIISP